MERRKERKFICDICEFKRLTKLKEEKKMRYRSGKRKIWKEELIRIPTKKIQREDERKARIRLTNSKEKK